MKSPHTLLALLTTFVTSVADLRGADALPVAAPGSSVAPFELRDVDGALHRSSDLTSSKAIVLVYHGVDCPISRLYARRAGELAVAYAERGVTFLGVSAHRQDDADELRAFAKEFELRYPILVDRRHALSDALGVTRMTEVLAIDSSGVLRYRGSLDDQYSLGRESIGRRKDRPERHYLKDALDAVLDGREVAVATTDAYGCLLTRESADAAKGSATWIDDIEPIVRENCQTCHFEGRIAPFELVTYEDASGWAAMIGEVVVQGRMPPWHAESAPGVFENDRRLSEKDRSTLLAWVDAGAPRGEGAERPREDRPAEDAAWLIGTPDLVVEMPREFEVPATGTIEYQYFSVPTGLEEDRWVEAIEVLPGDRDVVHHVLLFIDDPRRPGRGLREDGGGVEGYFGAMVPGERPAVFPPGMAKRLPAGSSIVFQVHYTTDGEPHRDRSRVGLRFATGPVEHEVRTRSVHETRLRIPAGAESHRVRATFPVRKDALILSFLPHMHLRGSAFVYRAHYPSSVAVSKAPWEGRFRRESLARMHYDAPTGQLTWAGEVSDEALAELEAVYTDAGDREKLNELRANARTETLLDVPRYDFGWQNTYRLREPKRLPAGSLIEGIATYDNSARNPALTREMWSRRVRWGDQTWNEMMIGYFDLVWLD